MRASLLMIALFSAASARAAAVAPSPSPSATAAVRDVGAVIRALPPVTQFMALDILGQPVTGRELSRAALAPFVDPALETLSAKSESPYDLHRLAAAESLSALDVHVGAHLDDPEQRRAIHDATVLVTKTLPPELRRRVLDNMGEWAKALGYSAEIPVEAAGTSAVPPPLAAHDRENSSRVAAPPVAERPLNVDKERRTGSRALLALGAGSLLTNVIFYGQASMRGETPTGAFVLGAIGLAALAVWTSLAAWRIQRRLLARRARLEQEKSSQAAEKMTKDANAAVAKTRDMIAKSAWTALSVSLEGPHSIESLHAEVARLIRAEDARLAPPAALDQPYRFERQLKAAFFMNELSAESDRLARSSPDAESYRIQLVELSNRIKEWAYAGGEFPF